MAKEPPARAPAFRGESENRPRLVRFTTVDNTRITLIAETVEAVVEQSNGGVIIVTATDSYGVLGGFRAIEDKIWPESD